MRLSYFVVDGQGTLRKARRADIEGLWHGTHRAEDLGCPAANEMRLVSVLCDRRLTPHKIYLLRVPLTDGRFTEAHLLTLRVYSRPDCVTPQEVVEHHTAGWPRDFFRQMAVALDVPIQSLTVPLGVGGPLFMAAKLRVPLREAIHYLR
jgi:hypothetical protein